MKQFLQHLKTLGTLTLKDKGSLFWVFFYPLILITLMALTFGGIQSSMEPVKVAVEKGHPWKIAFFQMDILDPVEMEEQSALESLQERDVWGVFLSDKSLVVAESSAQSSVLFEIASELQRNEKAMRLGVRPDYSKDFVRTADQETDMMLSILSVTVGMFSLYAYFSGIGMVDHIQANLSPLAARLAVTPLSRGSYLLAGTAINTFLSLAESVVLLLYLKWVWGVNFLVDAPRSLFLLLVAGLLGLTVGLFIGASNRWPMKVKIPLGIILMLVLGAFGGMMSTELRVFFDRHLPILNRVNPIHIIGRELYRLNALRMTDGYALSVLSLFLAALFLFGAALFFMRPRPFRSL